MARYEKHLTTIKELYSIDLKSDTLDYIHHLDERINSIPNIVNTPVPIINAILSDELRKAKKESIDVRMDFNISSEIKFNPADLCALLGNTVENAIDACGVLPNNAERYINIKILQDTSFILIDVKNPFCPYVDIVQRDNRKHGYGLKNVCKIVKKYGGDIQISNNNDIFHVSLIIHYS